MESDINDSTDSFGLICVASDDFNYLDSTDSWLISSDSHNNCIKNLTLNENNNNSNNNNNDINDWLKNAFTKERSKGYHMTLVNKLDELKLLSPHSSVDSRTFTRHKRNNNKRESIFNGSVLSTLYSPVDENECTPESTITYETHNRTFEVQTNKTLLNGTFTLENDCVEDDIQLNNIDDVEKIAKRQEENLRQSCSNGSSPSRQRSPIRSNLSNVNNRDKRLSYLPNSNSNHNINSNTLTKNRDSIARHSALANALMDDLSAYPMSTEDDDDYYYENGYSPEENMFRTSHLAHNTSTPLVSQTGHNVTFAQHEMTRGSVAPKIMPNFSNLRAHSSYGHSKIGRSEPNLSKRLQPLNKGIPNNSSKTNHFGARNNASSLIQSKMPSDSGLVVRNGLIRQPFRHQTQTQTLGRMTSPPPSQSQQQLVGKVTVEGECNRIGSTATTTNLCRKSTFRVRDYATNSEENLRDNGIDFCITNSNPISNGYKTNQLINNNNTKQTNVPRNVSKIPGPKPVRSGIPVSGKRTAIPGPANHKPQNHTDNSWRNGCF